MPDAPTPDPEFTDFAPKPPPGRTFSLGRVLLILGIGVLVVMLFLPAGVRSARRSARRLQCASNLRHIAIALQQYEQAYGCLPPARTVDAAGRPLHSWRTLILPFFDSTELYNSIDLAKPWDDPANAAACRTVGIYHCPELLEPRDTTTYLAVADPGGCFLPTGLRRLAKITDDHAQTLMMIEAGAGNAVPWMKPADADEALVLGLGRGPVDDLCHAGGFNACFVDASVKFLGSDLPTELRRALVTIAGRDAIDPSALGD